MQGPVGDRTGDQTHGLHQPGPAVGVVPGEQRTLDRQRDVIGRGLRPAPERALIDDGGEPAGRNARDQPADRVQSGRARSQRPRGMFAQKGAGIGQQVRQRRRGAVVEHRAQRVHGRDGDQLVVVATLDEVVNDPGEDLDGVRAAVLPGRRGQPVSGADRIEQEGSVSHLRERGKQSHVMSRFGSTAVTFRHPDWTLSVPIEGNVQTAGPAFGTAVPGKMDAGPSSHRKSA